MATMSVSESGRYNPPAGPGGAGFTLGGAARCARRALRPDLRVAVLAANSDIKSLSIQSVAFKMHTLKSCIAGSYFGK